MKRLLFVLFLLSAPALADQGPLPLDHPTASRGDPVASLDAFLTAIEADPRDPAVPLLLNEVGQAAPWVPGGRARARDRLLQVIDALGVHWSSDELRARAFDLSLALHDLPRAQALQAARGFIRDWQVVGGFGLRPAAALHDPFEPEQAAAARELSATQRFRTRRGERGWIPLVLRPMQIAVTPGEQSPDGAVSYALTHVELPAAVEGFLVYTGPSAKVWVNRVLASTVDRDAERLDGELRLPVKLRAGWNRLLLKVGGGRSARFTLRIVDGQGGPVLPARIAASQAVDAEPGSPEPPRESWVASQLALEKSARRRALHAVHFLATGRGEEAWLLLEDLVAAHPGLREEPWFLVLEGDAAQRADHLPPAVRRDRARQAYGAALQRAPDHARALRRLAEFSFQDDRPTEAIQQLEKLLAAHPGDLDTRLRLADALLAKGWVEEADQALAEARALGPDLSPVVAASARVHQRLERVAEARAAEERLWELDGSQTWVLVRGLERAQTANDPARVRAATEALVGLGLWGPEDLVRRRVASTRATGDREGELAALRELMALRPADPDVRLNLAQRLLEQPEPAPKVLAEARELLDQVLLAVPGHHGARRLKQASAGAEERWWEEWAPDLQRMVAESPGRERWPRDATVCLFDQTVTRVWPDGAAEDVVHQVWRLLDSSGKEKLGSRPKAGELLRIRTITPAGESLEPIGAGQTFEMPGLNPGAFVEHAWRASRDAPPVQYTNGPFYFMDPDLGEPFLLSRWVIQVHRDAPVDLVERNLARRGITHEVLARGEWRVHVYTARDQPRFEREPLMPHRDEVLPWVKIVERRQLEELGELYRGRALEERATSPSVARKAAELTHELDGDDLAKVERLWRFVQDHVTRDAGGRTASQVLAARGGSKLVLLRALLQAAGLQVQWVVAAPREELGEPIDWAHPEPSHLSISLLRVLPRGGRPLYLFPDGHRLSPWRALPLQLWGATAWVCEAGGGVLEVLPGGDAGDEVTRTATRLALAEGGRASFEVERVLPAYGAYRLKELFGRAPAQELRQFFAQQANELFPGASVSASETPDTAVPGVPFRFRFSGQAQEVVNPRTLELKLPLGSSPLRGLGTHRQRLFELVIGLGLAENGVGRRDQVEIELGPFVCPRTPDSVTIVNEHGQYSLLFVREGDRIRIERALTLRPGRISPTEYPGFLEFLARIEEAERRTLILESR